MSHLSSTVSTHSLAIECRKPYCGEPAPLAGRFDPAQQPWNQYEPDCVLPEEECPQCQTANIKDIHYEDIEVNSNEWIQAVCDEATRAAQSGGGPFAALLLQIDRETNDVIRYWVAHNSVTSTVDPTAHAEVNAVRAACQQLGVYHLNKILKADSEMPQPGDESYCVMYSSTEPCPMCLAAIYWAHIPTVVFAATRHDAAQDGVGFDDAQIYDELCKPYNQRSHVNVFQATTDNSLDAFNFWKRNPKTPY